jgi:hypothetical protein
MAAAHALNFSNVVRKNLKMKAFFNAKELSPDRQTNRDYLDFANSVR